MQNNGSPSSGVQQPSADQPRYSTDQLRAEEKAPTMQYRQTNIKTYSGRYNRDSRR